MDDKTRFCLVSFDGRFWCIPCNKKAEWDKMCATFAYQMDDDFNEPSWARHVKTPCDLTFTSTAFIQTERVT